MNAPLYLIIGLLCFLILIIFLLLLPILTKMKVKYKQGDIFEGINTIDNHKTLIHVCNNKGGWGKGFVLALSKFNRLPEQVFKNSFKNNINCSLGNIQNIDITKKLTVVNMIAQNGYKSNTNPVPLDYNALDKCMGIIANNIIFMKEATTIIAPKIGTGLAGGNWELIETLLIKNFTEKGIPVTIYELD